ncbi:MAG: cofactor-independent phosphoglycerate mutase [Planctomycetes bacterium]|nr:cofactor-independent phosphoglycerate mutase [Planctomycetota bacterium]
MKYFMLIADGMADYAVEPLQGKTPLEAARTVNLDHISHDGKLGVVRTVPRGMRPDTETSLLSLLGYDPRKQRIGRAPFEAIGFGIEMQPQETAFSCNLVTADEENLADYCAGHIGDKEAGVLIQFLQENLSTKHVTFHAGRSFRNIMVYSGDEPMVVDTTPPHDVIGADFSGHLPAGQGSQLLRRLILGSHSLLEEHAINVVRADLGENPANMIWLWGQGRPPQLQPFPERYGKTGIMITASPLFMGVARTIGWDHIAVPGATGLIDTDYTAKGNAAVEALETHDLVVVHVASPDVAGHDGDPLRKVVAIEGIDEKVVGPVLQAMERLPEYRILVAINHFSPVAERGHTADPVPFAVFGSGIRVIRQVPFTEKNAEEGDLHIEFGHGLMEYFLHEDQPLRKMEMPHPPAE